MKNFALLTILLILLTLNSESFAQISKKDFDNAVQYSIQQLMKTAAEIPAGKYPIRTKGIDGWEFTDPSVWTSGFFPGSLWYAYQLNKDNNILDSAKKFTEGLKDQQYNIYTHDIGFMMLNSYGNGYKITGDTSYKNIILQSAKSLASRFNKKTGCLQSWNGDFQVIIDNMMNLEILFWSSKNGGSKNLYDIAVSHAYTTIKNHLREDGSSFHVVVYDTATGDVLKKRTAQGFSDSSSWARGQAWGIYGFTMCYRETKNKDFLSTAVKMADYFTENLPKDFIPYWDFQLPVDNPRKYRDASAACIALSGLMELRNYIDDKSKYDMLINNIMQALINNYLSINSNSSGIILHCAYNANNSNPFDWDASTVWGDYYFMEALLRYKESFF